MSDTNCTIRLGLNSYSKLQTFLSFEKRWLEHMITISTYVTMLVKAWRLVRKKIESIIVQPQAKSKRWSSTNKTIRPPPKTLFTNHCFFIRVKISSKIIVYKTLVVLCSSANRYKYNWTYFKFYTILFYYKTRNSKDKFHFYIWEIIYYSLFFYYYSILVLIQQKGARH